MTIAVDKAIYSREVLLKTACCFTDRVYIHLAQNETDWLITWTPKAQETLLPGEFENELIAQQLRLQLLQKTADIRKLILARAFASTIIDDSAEPSAEEEAPQNTGSDEDVLKGWFEGNDGI